MSAQPDLFPDRPFAEVFGDARTYIQLPPRRPKPLRRVLREPEPSTPRSEAQTAKDFLKEHANAIKSEARARCDFKKSVRLNASLDEQHRLRETMEHEQRRLAHLYLTLCRMLTR